MPRKPTIYSRSAEAAIRELLGPGGLPSEHPLPSVRELGSKLGVSFATISRTLHRLGQEGIVWQHPNGRFYRVADRGAIAKGLPVVILGRQIQNWSALYQEILEGISEICSARGCPLVFLSSTSLVRHESPEFPPAFASKAVQRKEIMSLLEAVPRPCGGLLLDHLWCDELALLAADSVRSTALLIRQCPSLKNASGSVDIESGSRTVLQHLQELGYSNLILALPFPGDQAVDAAAAALLSCARGGRIWSGSIETADCSTPGLRRKWIRSLKKKKDRTAVVSIEDNVTALLWQEFQAADLECPGRIGLVSLQGTSAVGSSISRLRYNYRLLGRQVVSSLLDDDRSCRPLRPALIRGSTLLAG